jgi:hypothetical protein
VHIEVQRAAEALDEGDDAGAGTIGGLQTRPAAGRTLDWQTWDQVPEAG